MAETLRARERTRRPPIAALFGLFTPLFNGPIARLAGSRYLPIWALLHHQGRRSGREYATPVAARRTPNGFVVPLAFGETSDWCRNVLAAGGAEITWKGRTYRVTDPRIVPAAEVIDAFPSFSRPLVTRGALTSALRLRDA